jgi:hypothetical protein
MDSPRLSRDLLAFLVGVPLAWAVLLLFHPGGDGEQIYRDVQDSVTAFMVVHLGMLVFIPLMAAAIWLLLRGIDGTAATVSRIALVPFVIFYSAWETLQGIGVGILASEVNGLPAAERGTGAELVQNFAENPLSVSLGVFATIGSLSLILATIAAGVALRREAGAPMAVPVLLGLSGLLITAHPPPYGPTGLVLFAAAVFIYARSQSTARAPAPLPQPG